MCRSWRETRASPRLRGESRLPLLRQRGPQCGKDALPPPAKLPAGKLQREVAKLLPGVLDGAIEEPSDIDIREKRVLHQARTTAGPRLQSTRPVHQLGDVLPSRNRTNVSQTGGILLHLVLWGNKIEHTKSALFAEGKGPGLRIRSLAIGRDLPAWLVDADAEVGLVQVRQRRKDDLPQLPLGSSPPKAPSTRAAAPSAAGPFRLHRRFAAARGSHRDPTNTSEGESSA